MRFLAAALAFAVLVVVDETRAAPVSSTGRRKASNGCGCTDVLTAVNQFESAVRSATAVTNRPFVGPSSEQNTAIDPDGGRRNIANAAMAATSSQRPPTDMKNDRSSGGIGKMMRRAIGKFKHDSGHRTSIVPTSVNSVFTAPPNRRLSYKYTCIYKISNTKKILLSNITKFRLTIVNSYLQTIFSPFIMLQYIIFSDIDI
ncbi:hypothetical protein AGLY_006915 [Aphis glycines]|uniref:Uncharacterized protein n=1 Tax=Aphis glycines TaxID=307491 RepID=A0A6G0TSB1_APHGL|nr:hypothetical protein AGLY_006915 [Aphis glycines]